MKRSATFPGSGSASPVIGPIGTMYGWKSAPHASAAELKPLACEAGEFVVTAVEGTPVFQKLMITADILQELTATASTDGGEKR